MKKKKTLEYYPIALRLDRRRSVVAGGGPVAERKVLALLGAGCKVKVVSPSATNRLKKLAKKKDVKWVQRRIRKSDLKGADLIVAATSDPAVNKLISLWSRKTGGLLNVVDKPLLSDFISPAVFSAGDAIISVYTDGKYPVLSRDLKNFIKERWDDFLHYRNRS